MLEQGSQGNSALIAKIAANIERNGAIPFRDYMEICLYDPEFGYYTSKSDKIGPDGDFYTSASVGGIMGEVLAMAFVKESPADEPLDIVEWGGGTGKLAGQILDTLAARYPDHYSGVTYTLIDRSPDHRAKAAAALASHEAVIRVVSPDDWHGAPEGRFTIVFSNELLDSFPVYRVRWRNGRLLELYVEWNREEGRFTEIERPCTNAELLRYVEEGGIRLLDGQTADINLEAPRWIEERLQGLSRGLLLTIDYGDRAEELFAPHRMNGTLVCYKRHTAHDNPYASVGNQDITAHVDFSACLRAGERVGAAGTLLTQREFLVEAGVLSLLQEHAGRDPFSPEAKRNRSIRQLLLSDQMSELFKVLVQRRG